MTGAAVTVAPLHLRVVRVLGGGWVIEGRVRLRGRWQVLSRESGFASEGAATAEMCRQIRGDPVGLRRG